MNINKKLSLYLLTIGILLTPLNSSANTSVVTKMGAAECPSGYNLLSVNPTSKMKNATGKIHPYSLFMGCENISTTGVSNCRAARVYFDSRDYDAEYISSWLTDSTPGIAEIKIICAKTCGN